MNSGKVSTKRYPFYKYVLAALDWSAIMLAILLATSGTAMAMLPPDLLFVISAFYAFAAIIVLHYHDLYRINVFVTLFNHSIALLKSLAWLGAGTAILLFFTHDFFSGDGREELLHFAGVALGLLLLMRLVIFRQMFLYLSKHQIVQRNALIVGAGSTGRNVAVNLFLHDYVGLRVVGFLDDDGAIGTVIFNGSKIIGGTAEMGACVRQYDVEEIIICLENVDYTRLMELTDLATHMGCIIKVASPLYEIISVRRAIEHYGNIPVVGVFQSGLTLRRQRYKRVFDVVASLLLLLVHLPLLVLIAVAIKIESPGPVFFRQVRIGRNGEPFEFLKFRSMLLGSEADDERRERMKDFMRTKRKFDPKDAAFTKIVNEARVTRVGKILRRLSLDELPQLINVVRGDMSLVGPRPCLQYEWEQYEDWHKLRLSVLPGCTGVWQVLGRSVVGFDDMVVLDLHYIQNATLVLDCRLILKTIPVMIFGSGGR